MPCPGLKGVAMTDEYELFAWVFSWEPALETLNSQAEDVKKDDVKKKSIAIFGYKQWLLSLDMKTKVVQHDEREWI